jgi:hypothetical protein
MFHGQNKEWMSCENGTNIENGENSLKTLRNTSLILTMHSLWKLKLNGCLAKDD